MTDKKFERRMAITNYVFALYIIIPFILAYVLSISGYSEYLLRDLFWGLNWVNLFSFVLGACFIIIIRKVENSHYD